jgi:hypothetical protein
MYLLLRVGRAKGAKLVTLMMDEEKGRGRREERAGKGFVLLGGRAKGANSSFHF